MFDPSQAKIVITGGSGFIGTHMVQHCLGEAMTFANIDCRPPMLTQHQSFWTRVDLLDSQGLIEFFQQYRPTHVVHLAARTDLDEKKNLQGYAANTTGVENLIQAIQQAGSVQRALFASSMLVCRLGYRPTSPEDYAPSTLYGESKVLTEKIIRSRNPSCCWAIMRPATIWGPYHERLRQGVFRTLMKGYYFHPGSAPCWKSYGYVANTIHQIRKLLEAPQEQIHQQVYNLADPPINLREWVEEFSQQLRGKGITIVPLWMMTLGGWAGDFASHLGMKNVPLSSFRVKNMCTENIVDTGPISAVAGDSPWSMSQGVQATVAWLKKP